MAPIKRWIFLGLSLSLLLLTGVRAWASPSLGANKPAVVLQPPQNAQPPQAQPEQPKQDQAKSTTFIGTVVRDGEQFVLRDSSGGIFKLDDSGRAQQFEGKAVKVTGRLDVEAKLIHIDSIEAASA